MQPLTVGDMSSFLKNTSVSAIQPIKNVVYSDKKTEMMEQISESSYKTASATMCIAVIGKMSAQALRELNSTTDPQRKAILTKQIDEYAKLLQEQTDIIKQVQKQAKEIQATSIA